MSRKKKQRKPTKVIQESQRHLKASGSGYVKDPAYALGKETRHPTPVEYLVEGEEAREPEPEAVPARDQERFSKEARERYREMNLERDRRTVMRSRLAVLRQLGIEHVKAGMEPDAALDLAYEKLRRKAA